MELVFATNNANKVDEVAALLGDKFKLYTLAAINCHDEIEETATTLEGNALLKATHVVEKYGRNCFADDTGLEIEALDGRPGVYSARYAGEACKAEDNINKVLAEMQGATNRKARFRTVIALHLNGETHYFEGIVNGEITTTRQGEKGFGYDPIFKPEGQSLTFAQMSMQEKNAMSHRGRAVHQLVTFLSSVLKDA
jgi:XTP/dITP diphosphohydrolase